MLVLIALFSCGPGTPDPLATFRGEDAALVEQVGALTEAERALVRTELRAALERGDLSRAAEAAAHAPELAVAVADAARDLPTDVRAELLQRLAVHAPELSPEAERLGVEARWGPWREETMGRTRGVRRGHGLAALELVDER